MSLDAKMPTLRDKQRARDAAEAAEREAKAAAEAEKVEEKLPVKKKK
jgi:hypothetical protein